MPKMLVITEGDMPTRRIRVASSFDIGEATRHGTIHTSDGCYSEAQSTYHFEADEEPGLALATALRSFLRPQARPSDLARKAGVSRQYVHAVMAGKRPPSARLIEAAHDLGFPEEKLIGGC